MMHHEGASDRVERCLDIGAPSQLGLEGSRFPVVRPLWMSVGKFVGIRYRFRLGVAHRPSHLKGKKEKGAASHSAPY